MTTPAYCGVQAGCIYESERERKTDRVFAGVLLLSLHEKTETVVSSFCASERRFCYFRLQREKKLSRFSSIWPDIGRTKLSFELI